MSPGAVPVRVLVVEDHALLGDSLAVALSAEGYEVARPEALDPPSVLATATSFVPQVVLLDLRLDEDTTALPMIGPLRDLGASVVMVTGETNRVALAECVEAGAVGLVHKSEPFDAFIDAVARTAELRVTLSRRERDELLRTLADHRAADRERNEPFDQLTVREQQILAGLMDGLNAAELAARDYVALATVRSQIRAVLAKLGVNSQLAAVALARAAGWRPGDA